MLNKFLKSKNILYICLILAIPSISLRASDETVQHLPRIFNITSHLYGISTTDEHHQLTLQPSIDKLQNKFDTDKKENFYKWLRIRDQRFDTYKKVREQDPASLKDALSRFIGSQGYYRTILSQHELENLIYRSVFNPRKKFKAEYKQSPYRTPPQNLKGSERVGGFILSPLDLRISLSMLPRLVNDLEREIFVLEKIIISHKADLKKRVNGWSSAQLSEWWAGMPILIQSLQKKISSEVTEQFGTFPLNKKPQSFRLPKKYSSNYSDDMKKTEEELKFENIYHGLDTVKERTEFNKSTAFLWRKISSRKKPGGIEDGIMYSEETDFKVPLGTEMTIEYRAFFTLREHRFDYGKVLLELRENFELSTSIAPDSQTSNPQFSYPGVLIPQPNKKRKFAEPEADFDPKPASVTALLTKIRTPSYNSEEVKKWEYDVQDLTKYKELHDKYRVLLDKQKLLHQTLQKKPTYYGFNSYIPSPWELFFIEQQTPSHANSPLKSLKKE